MVTPVVKRKSGQAVRPIDTKLSLPVEGMSCASCVGRVERALKAVPGVQSAAVNLASERADVVVDDAAVVPAAIHAIESAGYRVPDESVELAIEGMTCASCVGRVEKALNQVRNVKAATVNLATERARVSYAAGTVTLADLISAVEQTGYRASLQRDASADAVSAADHRRQHEMQSLWRAWLLATSLTVPVLLLGMVADLVPAIGGWVRHALGEKVSWDIQFALASIVMFGPGLRFFRKGIPALLRGAPDMHSLVAVGTLAAYGYSFVATFLPHVLPAGTVHVYYEAATVIISLILLGRLLEARAKGRTSEAVKRLVGLQAKAARVERDGKVVEVAAEQVRVGDMVHVRPGEKVPVDGEVVDGHAYVDESMISGEPIPVAKDAGAKVVGGTIAQGGALRFKATGVGSATVLAQIIRMVEAAQGSKLPIQAIVDRITMWFVPAVMAAAAMTFLVWWIWGPSPALAFALVNAVAVLIVACPCAMGLATPTSIMVSTGRAAELGVLFRKGDALQALRDVKVVALDKTGTLTKGKPALTDLVTASGFERRDVLASLAAVESQSEHPIAQAIVQAARQEGVEGGMAETFASLAGLGVSAQVAARQVVVGADRLMHQRGLDVSVFAARATQLAAQGKSPFYIAIDGQVAAVAAVSDPVKPTSRAAIEALHALGLKVAMVTGDHRETANAVAAELGIDEVVAEVLPEGKVEAIRRLQAREGSLAFVGDGINDAPALATASVGLAIGTGTDVAIESADVVLVGGDLRGVVNAIALSKAAMRNIRENLLWAFGYNVILIPFAAGVFYPFAGVLLSPMISAAAMALSSVFVLGNALRLKRFQPPMEALAHKTEVQGA